LQRDKISTPGIQDILFSSPCVQNAEKDIYVSKFKYVWVNNMDAEKRFVGKKRFVKAEPATVADVATVRVKIEGLREELESAETLITLLRIFQ